MKTWTLNDFDFDLPTELIAQHPQVERSSSRLLIISPQDDVDDRVHFFNQHFYDLPNWLESGDLLVMNNTKVIKGRLYGQKLSGGKVELLVERIEADGMTMLAQLNTSKAPKPGSSIIFPSTVNAQVIERVRSFYRLRFSVNIWDYLEKHGEVPLPPYIKRSTTVHDASRYQTIFAQYAGAVAAPTAGLHMDEAVFTALKVKNIACASVTLHVGAGTFSPVRVDNLNEHRMHEERFSVSADLVEQITSTKQRGKKVWALGTTTLRALESAVNVEGILEARQDATTDLFILPGYQFQVVDGLITNFHLPKSTLLMLVSAFAGIDVMRKAYQHAINERYRFFSYGDAMLLRCARKKV